jgi:hypothetical protein
MRQGLTVPGGSVRTAKIYQYLVIFVVDDIVGARYESKSPLSASEEGNKIFFWCTQSMTATTLSR